VVDVHLVAFDQGWFLLVALGWFGWDLRPSGLWGLGPRLLGMLESRC
jgi:hypothetical protein